VPNKYMKGRPSQSSSEGGTDKDSTTTVYDKEEMAKLDSAAGTLPEKYESLAGGFRNNFVTPTPVQVTMDGLVYSDVGKTGTGKTSRAVKMICANAEDAPKEVELWDLPAKDHDIVIEALVKAYKGRKILPCKELFVVGTEKSTTECIYSDDIFPFIEPYLERGLFHYKEIFIRAKKDRGLEAGADAIESIKLLNKLIYDLEFDLETERKNEIGIVFDSSSTILGWANEVVRRNIMNIPKLAKYQGATANFWLWRNMKMESLALICRDINIPVYLTWQFKKDEKGKFTSAPNWYEKSGHLSSIIFYSFQQKDEDGSKFFLQFQKNRRKNNLVGRFFTGLSMNMINALSLGLEENMKKVLKMNKEKLEKLMAVPLD